MKIKFRGKKANKRTSNQQVEDKYERPEDHPTTNTRRAPLKKKIQAVFGSTSQ